MPATALGYGDAYLSKYDANGNLVWFRRFGTWQNDLGRSIAVDHTGDVAGVTGGSFSNPNGSSSGGADAFVRKYDFDGNVQWTDQFGYTGYDDAFGIGSYDWYDPGRKPISRTFTLWAIRTAPCCLV